MLSLRGWCRNRKCWSRPIYCLTDILNYSDKLTAPAKLPNNRNYRTQPPSSGHLQRLSCYNFINRSSSGRLQRLSCYNFINRSSSGRLQRLSCYNFINRSSSDLKAYRVVMCQPKSNYRSPTKIKELQMG